MHDALPHIDIRVHEARRSYERQRWLYRQGREHPYLNKPVVTWTMESVHLWGLGLDWHFVRKADPGNAVWDSSSYVYIYKLVPPGMFGLRTLASDLVHLEPFYARSMIEDRQLFGLYRT